MSVSRFDYVRAFGQATEDVTMQVLGETPSRGQPEFQVGSQISMQELNLIVGLTGEVRGQISYGLSRKTAKAIATLMLEEDVGEFDEMALSALSELANMISGGATVILANGGGRSDITPPSIIMGTSVRGAWYGIRAMIIPMSFSFGTLFLVVGLTADPDLTPSAIKRGTGEPRAR